MKPSLPQRIVSTAESRGEVVSRMLGLDDMMDYVVCLKKNRLAALHISGHNHKWSKIHAGDSYGKDAHRRLGGTSQPNLEVTKKYMPPCIDRNEDLQKEENDPTVNCTNFASHVCDIELGLLLCAKTCGYCSPFTYEHTHKYPKPQVSMLPAMIHQTRFVDGDCHSFAHQYNTQPYNPALNLLPAMDGKRHGDLIHCVDRSKHHEGEYAMEKVCPPGSPTTHCHNGKMKITEKHVFHDEIIYPEILIEPERDIARMKSVEWLDVNTDQVVLSTMIYTEEVEIFTSLAVVFTVDIAGNINSHIDIISYRDLVNGHSIVFVVVLVVASLGGCFGVGLSIRAFLKYPEKLSCGFTWFEAFSRAVMGIYAAVLLVSWSQQKPMSLEYDLLLHTFLDSESINSSSIGEVIQHYLDVDTEIYHETMWLSAHKIVCYIVCYFQFMQLVFYFNAHPRMATLTKTVFKAADSIMHFMALFGTLFCCLAFIAYWFFGEHIDGFGSYGAAVSTQGRMIFGEFIYVDGASELTSKDLAMYWIYAFTFMIVFFFTLLNFFLAIVVDAFNDVKQAVDDLVVEKSFLADTIQLPCTRLQALRHRWPSFAKLKQFFEDTVIEARNRKVQAELRKNGLQHSLLANLELERRSDDHHFSCSPDAILASFPGEFTQKNLSIFLAHYYRICPDVLCPTASQTYSEYPSEAQSHYSVDKFSLDDAEMGSKHEAPLVEVHQEGPPRATPDETRAKRGASGMLVRFAPGS
eukprot:TRINITY_DN25342_c0_g2_i1.p1 TRINITY_DN25342_c0_g2~~TRINITY_DN25342_c0_g2_i1.p1  ORF type:complete len:747 (-),score=105.00 TRINITY_DN25342_c0_g2_i1:240-2480(-)